jgi:hypothetical protein
MITSEGDSLEGESGHQYLGGRGLGSVVEGDLRVLDEVGSLVFMR